MKKAKTTRRPKAAVAQIVNIPALKKGEIYVRGTIDAAGIITHTILLPGEKANVTWKDALAWAKDKGGDLPTRIEQAMLWAHHRKLFKARWYWSNEQHAEDSSYAWLQSFNYGLQYYWLQVNKGMARAVRRVAI